MPKGNTAKPKGSTAKPSGTPNNSDSRRSKDHTAKPKGITAKPSGIVESSDSQINKDYTHSYYIKAPGQLSPPRPARRQIDWSDARSKKKREGEGDNIYYDKQHTYNRTKHESIKHSTDFNTKYDRNYLIKILLAMKPALVSWGTPPRGEPGEPRSIDQRTLSSQQRGAISLKTIDRLRNHNRGIRSPEKTSQRKQRAKTNQRIARIQARDYRTSTPLETRHSLARCVSNYLHDEDHRAFKDSNNQRNSNDRHHMGHKRTLFSICFGQDIEDKNKIAPREYRPKWEYADKLKVATLNVRGMKEFAKREQIIQEMISRKIDIMCIQETKLPSSTVEKRKGHTFVFSTNSKDNREHHGVGICYNNKMEKYRNNYKQINNHILTIEINMHGNPMTIASIYIPHDQTPDIPRQQAWELLDETITQTPIAKNIILLGDFNTSLHARKVGEEDHIGEHIFGRGREFLELKESYKPAWKTDNREMLTNMI
uniref:endonuclease/exonuclease/phosphatase family protein n=1 Tax=Flavobacterium sp. TaxID=239 RepID=UPI00404B0406